MAHDRLKAVRNFLLGVVAFFLLLFVFIMVGKYTVNRKHEESNIKSEQAMKEFVKGKWSSTRMYYGMTVHYRYEITESQIKYWTSGMEHQWGAEQTAWGEPEQILNYRLGEVETDSNGNQRRVLAEANCGTIILQSGKSGEAWLECVTSGGEDDYFEKGWK